MLQTISIQNFAIIEHVTVNFQEGMTVLTGETGAGKSIIIDALALLAGGRATADYIRHGSDKFVLQALFDIEQLPHIQKCLIDEAFPIEDNQLILTRELHKNGKGTVRINGVLTTVSMLKQLGVQLIDIHGQHEHQHLMDETKHLALLDQFAGEKLHDIKQVYHEKYMQYGTLKQQLKRLMASEQNEAQRIQMLKRHVADIQEVNPQVDEDRQLEEELKALSGAKRAAETLTKLDYYLSHEEMSVRTLLAQSIQETQQIATFEKDYATIDEQLNDTFSQVLDISRQVSQELDRLDFDEERLHFVGERLEQLDKLKERYGENINDIVAYREASEKELDLLLNKDKHLVTVQKDFLKAREQLLATGHALSQKRREVASQLECAVKNQLKDLYMDKVEFSVSFIATDKPKIKSTGLDDVEFLVATNAGEPLKPLVKVASGGEISRMMLALKTIFTVNQQMSTVIFDEIDTGVSGRVAQAIANKMHVIAENTQLLCISHLPQVAARADYHLFVKKIASQDRTHTEVALLTHEERRYEIARIFAGENVTDVALLHADELLGI